MAPARVVHVTSQLSVGGGARAAVTLAKYSARLGAFQHTLISLRRSTEPGLSLAREAGLAVLDAPGRDALTAAVVEADLVQLHFWNSPELYAFMRADWPRARLLVWLHIAGDTAPQVVTPEVAAIGDYLVPTSDYTAALPVVNAPGAAPGRLIAATPDYERLDGLERQPHAGFNIGYIGTVDFEKIHPDFVALHAGLDIPQARVIVCGPGAAYPRLRQQIEAAGLADLFDLRGYLTDLRPVLASLDVFGYPLRADNYSSAELVLREAMAAGVPPVVLPYGGAARIVTHNVTGLVVTDGAGYHAALEWLYRHPDERARLGENARREARDRFGPEGMASQFNAVYDDLLRQPKRARVWSGTARSGAGYFIESLGHWGDDFSVSLAGEDLDGCLAAEARIAAASPLLASAGAGGVLNYRNAYVQDAHLRVWAGLVLFGLGRAALAVAEFKAAREMGLRHWRVAWYQARAAEACGARGLAAELVGSILAAAPNFEPAQALSQRLASDDPPTRAAAGRE